MSKTNSHIIHKQVLNIILQNQNNHQQIENEMKEWYYKLLLPAIEETLDSFSSSGDFLLIDKLYIDLGIFNKENAVFRTKEQLKVALQKAAFNNLLEKNEFAYKNKHISELEEITGTFPNKTFSKEQAVVEVFFNFLKTGSIPVWYNDAAIPNLEKNLEENSNLFSGQIEKLTELGKKFPFIYYRLTYQFSENFIFHLINLDHNIKKNYSDSGIQIFYEYIVGNKTEIIQKHNQLFYASLKAEIVKIIFENKAPGQNIIEIIKLNLQKNKHIPELTTWFPELLHHFEKLVPFQTQKHNPVFIQAIHYYLENNITQEIKPLNESDKSHNILTTDVLLNSKSESTTFEKLITHSDTDINLQIENELALKEELIQTIFNENKTISGDQEYYYIKNSGIVLLNPYLEFFFKELGYTGDKSFKNRETLEKAVILLHYICYKDIKANENDLIINKVLCGIDINEPVFPLTFLNEREISESENLLTSVIRNWPALKNTKPDGLREGFLLREGKLSKINNGWKLQVERKSIDILLSAITWSYNVIKLPWIHLPLFVDWA